MNKPQLHLESVSASRELLLIGFDNNIDSYILDLPQNDNQYQYAQLQNSEAAFSWMEERVASLETYQLPYALLCDLQWLLADDFRLTSRMAAHPDLRYVPVIILTDKRRAVEKLELVKHNVDDCYTVPIPWEVLASRLDFLNQYKSKLLEYARDVRQENMTMRIPIAKRIFDLAVVTAALPFLIGPCLLVALAIRLESKGPVFYRSKRVGTGYRVFNFIKFRSMYQDADKRLKELAHLNQYNGSNGPTFVKIARDPRVTRVGRIIRKYSIDELPQLLNILYGDMSIVGNRPLPLYEAELLTQEEYCARFLAPAGLTGLWQVTKRGRSDMEAEERIALDLAYARQPYSIWRDAGIVLKTFTAFIQKEDV